jgi:hypothetical protein
MWTVEWVATGVFAIRIVYRGNTKCMFYSGVCSNYSLYQNSEENLLFEARGGVLETVRGWAPFPAAD